MVRFTVTHIKFKGALIGCKLITLAKYSLGIVQLAFYQSAYLTTNLTEQFKSNPTLTEVWRLCQVDRLTAALMPWIQ